MSTQNAITNANILLNWGFSDEQKLEVFIACKPAKQEVLKDSSSGQRTVVWDANSYIQEGIKKNRNGSKRVNIKG